MPTQEAIQGIKKLIDDPVQRIEVVNTFLVGIENTINEYLTGNSNVQKANLIYDLEYSYNTDYMVEFKKQLNNIDSNLFIEMGNRFSDLINSF